MTTALTKKFMRKTTSILLLTAICLGIIGCTEESGTESKSPSPANAPTQAASTNTDSAVANQPPQETPAAPGDKQ